MKLTDIVVERAVMEIFLEFGVPPRGRLALQVFQKDWHRWHLRAEDLHAGIRGLEARGWISRESEGSKVYLTITEQGFRHARVLPMRVINALDIVKHWSANAHKARRKGGGKNISARRRSTD